jgi:hypothetical protein
MKKMILSMAGSLLLGVAVTQAQDSTRTNTKQQQPQTYPQQTTTPQTTPPQSTQPTNTQPPPIQQPQTLPSQNQYRNDMVIIPQDRLPESLRTTLRGDEYQGWEQSKIYQDPSTGEYLLEMETTTTTPNNTNPNATSQDQSGLRTYRFDRYGRVINDKNKTGNNDN